MGKSTLSRILADRLHARRVFDPEDNPFLADFYKEKPGSAFRAQMYFLFERHRRLTEVMQGDAGTPLVSDFLFEKDKIFAYINLDNEELKLYERYFEMFATALKPPDLVIYLQATPDVLRERIAKKNRPRKSKSRTPTWKKSSGLTNISFFDTRLPICSSSTLRRLTSWTGTPIFSNFCVACRNPSRVRSIFCRWGKAKLKQGHRGSKGHAMPNTVEVS